MWSPHALSDDGLVLVTLVVLGAALLHSSWNAITHGIKDREIGFGLLGAGGLLAALPVALLAAPPHVEAWPYLAGSAGVHVGYYLLLMRAYRLGDFGQVYPLARGTSPLVVTGLAAAFVREVPSPAELAGIFVVSASLGFLAFPGREHGFPGREHGVPGRERRGSGAASPANRAAVLAALATGLTIAGYSVIDGIGVRDSGSALGYIGWLMTLEFFTVPLVLLIIRRRDLRNQPPRLIGAGLLAGALSVAAYGLVLWAQTRGALALIAALRESSVVFGTLIGAFIFRERLGRTRIIAALGITAGIVLLNV